ncbi:MAG: HD-GYP domain-containing protein [Solirubrobacterales bacterium]|nr:HD-GYP domain-containing protein [Solirubrobacterales bacterium]
MVRPRLIPAYAALLSGTALALALLTGGLPAYDRLPLFAALVVCVLVLDFVDSDLFGHGNFSPGTVATIALAAVFGPLGPLIAEAFAAAGRLARGASVVRIAFDFGALSLCGAIAAWAALTVPGHGLWPLLACAVAGIAYYVANSLTLVGVWVLDEGVAPLAAWRERLAWAAPHYLGYGLLGGLLVLVERRAGLLVFAIVGVPVAILWLGQKQYLDRTRTSAEELRTSHAELERAHTALRAASIATVASLARTIEAKDEYTSNHVERVSGYAVALARELGVLDGDLEGIALGAVIHDVGKVGVRDAVLLKPGRLDAGEWAEMRRHPEIASYILEGLELPQAAKDIARHHHERFDGGGYPDGLAGEGIPLAARVLAVVDTLDAMTTTRPYRNALNFETALSELRRHAGTQFCPTVLAALERSLRSSPATWANAQQAEGELVRAA